MILNENPVASAESQVSGKKVPEDGRKRAATDGYFLLLQTVTICGLGVLMTYCVYHGGLARISRGYDNCKNVCGVQNFIRDDVKVAACEGIDMRYRPFHLVFRPDGRNSYNVTLTGMRALDFGVTPSLSDVVVRLCVVDCGMFYSYQPYKNRCILKKTRRVSDRFLIKTGGVSFFEGVAQDLEQCWRKILYLGAGSFALGASLAILVAFFPPTAIWLALIMPTVVCFVLSAYLWVLWVKSRQVLDQPGYLAGETELGASGSWLGFAIVSSLGVPCLIFFVWTQRRKIEVVIQLYREIARVITAMPFLLLQPFLSGVFVAAIVAAWFYMYLWIESSGLGRKLRPDFFVYEKDLLMVVTRWCNIFVSLWLVRFVLDCQRVVVAGAASYWYFCRSRNQLGIPVFYGFYHLVRYHLGSVSLGSLFGLTLYIPKQILKLIEKYEQKRGTTGTYCVKFSCWSKCREYILQYFTRNAYVEVFLFDCTFCQAGRRFFQVLSENPRAAAVKDLGDFVVASMKVLVSLVAILAAAVIFQGEESVLYLWVLLTFQGLVAYLIADCFFSLYQAVSDTMFVCFCEDCENFDGESKPCFTPQEFFEFVENCSRLLGISCLGEGDNQARDLSESSISSAVTIYD